MASPPAVPELETAQLERLTPLFHVVLLDDDEHTADYVVEMLCKLFVLARAEALRKARQVHKSGRSIVITCELEEAQFGRDQIHAFGPDRRNPKCTGSMRAIVEPVQARPG